jgi:hypothetical protein
MHVVKSKVSYALKVLVLGSCLKWADEGVRLIIMSWVT